MFLQHTAVKAAILTLLSTAALPLTAHAASYLDVNPLKRGEKTSYTASLSDITQGDVYRTTHTLDWRQPTLQLWFDLPASERTSDITLNLSADPLTRVPGHAPIMVQFNSDTPVPVLSNGRGFEAELSFDPAQGRPRRNSLRITFPAPTGADCVTPAHGQWSVNLAESTLSFGGRARPTNMSLTEVEARLSQPALAPKRVGLIAVGPNATDMQALAAQGISLRTPGVPKFSVTERDTDFNVLMVTRDRLFEYTDDPMILNSTGPRVFVPKGRPTQLIFTAKTDAEILETLKLFSIRHLPSARRPITSLGEIDMQNRLDQDRFLVADKVKLNELSNARTVATYDADNWASGAQVYRFDVADPAATSGEILLRLSASEDVAETSRLRVALNGEALGAAKLDRRRKSVIFDIAPGKLNANSNVLSLLPELDAKPGYSCPATSEGRPNFIIGDGSKLTLNTSTASPMTELSRLTATGSLFVDQQSYIALPRETRDFEASLRVLGRLAKSAGQGLTAADYTRKGEIGTDHHVLVIGPKTTQTAVLGDFDGAPAALLDAMRGQPVSGDNLLNAGIERFASTGADDFAVQYAAAQAAPRNVQRGGVAALYGAGHGRLVGVISSTPGESFTASANYLIEPAHWNALRGGVARWNKSSVLMAQTAQPAPGVNLPQSKGLSWPGFDSLDFDMPDWSMPTVSLPDWEWPTVSLPRFKRDTPVVKMAEAPTEPTAVLRRDTTPVATTPNWGKPAEMTPAVVKTTSVEPTPAASKSEGLRGTFQFDTPDMPEFKAPTFKAPHFGSFQEFRRDAKAKWRATQRWSKAKVDSVMNMRSLKKLERSADRLQNQVKPSGSKMRQTFVDKLPGKGIIQFADRTYSVFGLLLMLSFAIVVLLMSMAGPSSRLGGRH